MVDVVVGRRALPCGPLIGLRTSITKTHRTSTPSHAANLRIYGVYLPTVRRRSFCMLSIFGAQRKPRTEFYVLAYTPSLHCLWWCFLCGTLKTIPAYSFRIYLYIYIDNTPHAHIVVVLGSRGVRILINHVKPVHLVQRGERTGAAFATPIMTGQGN